MIGWPRRRVLLTWAAICAVLVVPLASQGLWLGPALSHFVMERSGRALDVGSVHAGLTGDLQPTIRFKELRIANAKWAEPRAFVDAREIRFTFSWRSLMESEWLVARLKLVDADVDMEIMADGLRNWRLSNPEDRGPGRVRVMTLDAVRSRVHLVHGAADVIADMAVADLPPD